MSPAKLLSTKSLQPAQRSRLLAAGFAVQSYEAVVAQVLAFDMPALPFQAIFTSQHAVKAFLAHEHLSTALPMLEAAYCVGERSAQRLRKKGIQVLLVADSAAALVKELFPKEASAAGQKSPLQTESPIFYFCGNRHLATIPNAFKAANTPLEIRVIYHSQGVHKAFETAFDVLFFYSPSGVQAFCEHNAIGASFVVAIGPTTAAEVALHSHHYTVAKRPSFAHMLSALRANYPTQLNKKTP